MRIGRPPLSGCLIFGLLCASGGLFVYFLASEFLRVEQPDYGFFTKGGDLWFADDHSRMGLVARSPIPMPKLTIEGQGKSRFLIIDDRGKKWSKRVDPDDFLDPDFLWSSRHKSIIFLLKHGTGEKLQILRWDAEKGFRPASTVQTRFVRMALSLDGDYLVLFNLGPLSGEPMSFRRVSLGSGEESEILFREPDFLQRWMLVKPDLILDLDQGSFIERRESGEEIGRKDSQWERFGMFEGKLYGARRVWSGFVVETIDPETKTATGEVADSRQMSLMGR